MTPSQKPNLEHTFLGSKDRYASLILTWTLWLTMASQTWSDNILVRFLPVSVFGALTIVIFWRLVKHYRDKRPAVRDIWRPSMLLMGGLVALVPLNLTCLILALWLEQFFNLDWPMQLYSVFVGPALFGSKVTLLILACICAGGVNPLIDDFLRYKMGSRTYREIRDERDAPHSAA